MEETKPRLRLVSVTVQPNYMLDDGETLTPVRVEPANVPAKDLRTFFDTWHESESKVAESLNATL